MQFCEVCGSMMRARGDQMVCVDQACGHRVDRDREQEDAFVSTDEQTDAEVIETSEADSFEGKPTAEVRCETCGNDRAYYTFMQTASADEPPTRFFKCTECGARWRGYN